MTQKNSTGNRNTSQASGGVYGTQVPQLPGDRADEAPNASRSESVVDESAADEAAADRSPRAADSDTAYRTLQAPPPASAMRRQAVVEARSGTARALPRMVHDAVTHSYRDARSGQGSLVEVMKTSRVADQLSESPLLAELGVREPPPKRRDPGRSTWNLRIHERDVAGKITGIINELLADPSGTGGLQSAMAQGINSPEYEILERVGAGNMGVVYRARQTSLNRDLAIKTLKPESHNPEHDQAMFVSEAVVTANLVHPNIVPIHDLGRTSDGKLFYSMKHVTGMPWSSTIKARSLEENLDIFIKVCDAVAYAHSRGVINRDLKPENVMIGEFGEVIVLDWGLAVTTEAFEKQDSVVVEFRGGTGSPVYMAPEMLHDDISGIGIHSDVYLLGAILFEVLEGFPPHLVKEAWGVEDPDEQLALVLRSVLDNEIEHDVVNTGELMQIARRAMAKEPADRFPSVEHLQDAVREYRITGRADELLRTIEDDRPDDYNDYQSAVALYSDAVRKWPNNRRAIDGDQKARVAYARLALRKGDYDLGMHIVADGGNPAFRPVRKQLRRARRKRGIIRATWTLLFLASVGLTGFTLFQEQRILNANQHVKEAELDAAEKIAAADERVRLADAEVATAEAKVTAAEQEAAAKVAAAEEEADRLVAEARDKERQALNAAATAQMAATEAADEASRFQEQAKTWRVEAERFREEQVIAKKAAEEAQKEAVAATAQLQDALTEKHKAELDGYLTRIDTAIELGQYGEAVLQIDEAIEALDASGNPEFDERKKDYLLKKRKAATARQQNAARHFPRTPIRSAFNASGSTAVLVTGGPDGPRLEFWQRAEVARALDDFTVTVLGNVSGSSDLAIAPDGGTICLVGRDATTVWQKNGESFAKAAVEPGVSGVRFRRCLFSGDGQRLYLFGDDNRLTVEIHDVSGERPNRLLSRQVWAEGNAVGMSDAVLLPDESALIVAPEQDNFTTAFPIAWNAGQPAMTAVSIEAPVLRGLTDERLSNSRFHVRRLAVSPNGDRLALVSDSDKVLVLPRDPQPEAGGFPFADPETLTDLNWFQSAFRVGRLAFSRDGQRLATLHENRYIQIWDLQDGRYAASRVDGLYQLRNQAGGLLRGHSSEVLAVTFVGASGTDLLSVGADQTIRRWDLVSYSGYIDALDDLRKTMKEQLSEATAGMAVRPERRGVTRTSPDGAWSASRYRTVSTHPGGQRPSSDETAQEQPPQRTRTVSESGLAIFGRSTAEPITINQGRNVFSARFSEDGDRLLVGSDDLAAHVFDSDSGGRTISMSGRRELFFDPNRNNFLEGHVSEIAAIRFLPPEGELLLTSDYFGSISVWDAAAGDDGIGYEKSRLLSQYSFSEFAVSPDGEWIVAGGAESDESEPLDDASLDHKGLVWRVADIRQAVTARPTIVLEGQHPQFAITAVGISPGAGRVVTGGRRGRIVVWDRESGNAVAVTDGAHGNDGVSGVFFTSEDELITSGFDGQVLRWSVDGDRLVLQQILVEQGQNDDQGQFILRMRPSPDCSRFTVSDIQAPPPGTPNAVRAILAVDLFSVDGEKLREIARESIPADDPERAVRHDVSWSLDGDRLLFTMDGVLTLYDADEWAVLQKYRLDKDDLKAVRGALAPDGQNGDIRAATFDGRFAHLWNLSDGSHVAEFRTHSYRTTASFSFDRKYVATASETIRIFESDEAAENHGQTLLRMKTGEAHVHPLAEVRFSPREGDYRFASVDQAGEVRIWDWSPAAPATARELYELPVPAMPRPDWGNDMEFGNAVAWDQDAQRLATVQEGVVGLRTLTEAGPEAVALPLPPQTECRFNEVTFSRTRPLLAAAGLRYDVNTAQLDSIALVWRIADDGSVTLIGQAEGGHSTVSRSRDQRTGVTSLAFDDTADELLTGGADGRLIRWQLGDPDAESVEDLSQIVEKLLPGDESPHDRAVTGVDVADDGRAVSTDEQGLIRIWPAIAN